MISSHVKLFDNNQCARFAVEQDPDPESLSCENLKCGDDIGIGYIVAIVRVIFMHDRVLVIVGDLEGVKVFRLDKMTFTTATSCHPLVQCLIEWSWMMA
uniref:Uncharacterized protein n=1 Tax=Oryza glumipatula TaxID=40148 RepID=A0A0E0ASN2_9ORYZ